MLSGMVTRSAACKTTKKSRNTSDPNYDSMARPADATMPPIQSISVHSLVNIGIVLCVLGGGFGKDHIAAMVARTDALPDK